MANDDTPQPELQNCIQSKWSKDEETTIEFFEGLIPILYEVKKDLETKDLVD